MNDITTKLTKIAENMPNVYKTGYTKGKAEGVVDGKQEEFMRFWGEYQNYGNKKSYDAAFKNGYWTDKTFQPQYDIVASSLAQAFHYTQIKDLKSKLSAKGLKFDTSQCTSFNQTFQGTRIAEIPEINMRSVTASYNISYTFASSDFIQKIDNIVLHDTYNLDINAFNGTKNLEEVRFTGKIRADFKISWSSKLSVESAKSIINALENYKDTDHEDEYYLYLHADTWAKLETESPREDGLTWKEYIDTELGWKY